MRAIAYVDGSFNARTQIFGAGAVLFTDDNPDNIIKISHADSVPAFAEARNVAGEVTAVILAVEACKCMEGLEGLTIYYDYAGIECWPRRIWANANKPISKMYREYMDRCEIPIEYRKVKAHSGDLHNDMADALAKKACGL